ncbi:MAG: hypothetical protein SGJ01_02190 [Gemmatimonadota bacterium]|nr:hypothetical protein [Gemmatimonadota bacterium]
MYRIRLANGEEAVFRSAKELTTAVASGVVSPTAEVFHNSGSRWLPINLHPDYKAATSGQQPSLPFPAPLAKTSPGQAPERAVAQTPNSPKKFARPSPTPPPRLAPTSLTTVVEESSRQSGPEVAVARAVPVTGVAGFDSRARKLRVMLALSMSLAGIISLGGAALMVGPPLKRGVARLSAVFQRSEGMDPALPEVLVPRADSGLSLFPAPSAPYPMAAAARLDSLLAGRPGTTTTQLRASRPKSISYSEAYADARDEMDTGLDYINFQRVFAGYRFASLDSVRATRRTVAAAGNILRVYRGREVMLEQTYRPDDPGGHGSFREPFETAEASRALIGNVDSLFGLLVAQQGRFSWTESGLRFQEARTARLYQRLRSEILQSLAAWRDSAPGPNRATFPRLTAGIGPLGPPPAH